MSKASPSAAVCPKCQGRSYLIQRREDRATARVCECSSPCRYCGGSGYSLTSQQGTFSQKMGPRQYEVMAPCACQLLASRVSRYNEALIPGVLAHAQFENYVPAVEGQYRAQQVATAFAMNFQRSKPSRGFILSGPVGAGKTHLLAAALSHLVLELGVVGRYVEISLLYATIRRGFQEGKSGGEIIGPLADVEVLAIDELGKGRGSPFEMETMDELIARRYNAGRTTLFATNYSLEYEKKPQRHASGHRTTEELKGASRETEQLRERVGERIYSRLCEMCEFVEMPGAPDHRHMEHEKQRPSRAAPTRHRAG
ncbi:MAG TPA: ATP-binding protein [Myxococcaceae bacterium]|nr:ATP-binding protein [Myxococcaceae bacterium]